MSTKPWDDLMPFQQRVRYVLWVIRWRFSPARFKHRCQVFLFERGLYRWPRGRITNIGTIATVGGLKQAVDWCFDCAGTKDVIAYHILSNGRVLFCGYTIEELEQISRSARD